MKTLLLSGATGLVGQSVLQLALADARVDKVVAPTRRPLPAHPKLENPVEDFDALPAEAPWWHVDGVICTLGTTRRRAGPQAAFRRVDFDYPLAVARLAKTHGAAAFALNSSLGADPQARVFYARTKGEVEAALRTVGYPSLTLVRPGLLGGGRTEFRFGERLATLGLTVLGPVLPRRYRIVPAVRVAAALLESALAAAPGVQVIESEQL
jgi:uncharacterized protein YbjT (DUF2867 family)